MAYAKSAERNRFLEGALAAGAGLGPRSAIRPSVLRSSGSGLSAEALASLSMPMDAKRNRGFFLTAARAAGASRAPKLSPPAAGPLVAAAAAECAAFGATAPLPKTADAANEGAASDLPSQELSQPGRCTA